MLRMPSRKSHGSSATHSKKHVLPARGPVPWLEKAAPLPGGLDEHNEFPTNEDSNPSKVQMGGAGLNFGRLEVF